MNQNLDTEVAAVLRRSTTNGNVLQLPSGQLDRKLYERVNKALTNAGGKWKKGVGHVFPTDPALKLAAMLDSGISIDEKKRDQSFFTPLALARRVVTLADVRGRVVLEPEAGMGVLAHECKRQRAKEVVVFEINPEYRAYLSESYRALGADFLKAEPICQVERIVMNPPFTKNQDIVHVKHALRWLAPQGVLVSLMMPNQNRKGFQEIIAEHKPEITEVERGAFKESGTDIATAIIRITKP